MVAPPTTFRRLAFLLAGILAFACDDGGPAAPRLGPAIGPPPTVSLTTGFGLSPLEGRLVLEVPAGSSGWRYRVEFSGDGVLDREGVADSTVTLPFRLTAPGVQSFRVFLESEDETIEVVLPVVVAESRGLTILEAAQITASEFGFQSFEGLAVTPDGLRMYLGDFQEGVLVEAQTSRPGVPLTVVQTFHGLEGLSVSPSGDFLFVAGTDWIVGRFAIPGLAPQPLRSRFFEFGDIGQFYVTALDDRRAVYSGGDLVVLDVAGLTLVARGTDETGAPTRAGHHSASPDRSEIIAVDGNDFRDVHVYSVPALQRLQTIRLPEGFTPDLVSFGEDAGTIYVLGYFPGGPDVPFDEFPSRFLVYDRATGALRHALTLDLPPCRFYCAANPTARSTDGRWVALEWGDGSVLFVDTTLDLPTRLMSPSQEGASVAASPADPSTFWTLSAAGVLLKVLVSP